MKIDWGNLLFIGLYHLGLLVGLPFFFIYCSLPVGIIIASIILLYLSGFSITAGYHRLFSHQTYKTNRLIEGIILFFGTMATQGSALQWAYDHRLHHSHVDTDQDPYSIKKGFLYAHLLWMFKKRPRPEKKVVSDLMQNPLIMFQHKYFVPLMIVTNMIPVIFFGWLFDNYLASFTFTWWVRLFLLHHFTWFINSLAHTWGSKSFSQEHSAVDNFLISLVTFGEGYHNYHHTFAFDFRNGIKWYHFDPSKWIIWSLAKLGLASNLKRVHEVRIKERMIKERKKEVLERITNYWFIHKPAIEEKINKLSENLLGELERIKTLSRKYLEEKKQKSPKESLNNLQTAIKQVQEKLQKDFKDWERISKRLLKMPDLSHQ